MKTRSPVGSAARASRGQWRHTSRGAMLVAVPLLLSACASAGGVRRGVSPAVAAVRQAADSLLADPMFRRMQWGILVVDPARAETLYAHNAGKLFMPASNQKILTGAVALHLLGPEYRFTTAIGARGTLVAGVQHGDLVVTGSGDPSVSDRMAGDAMRPLRAIADSLAARGIGRITGRLLADGSHFSDAPLGYGWSWDDVDAPYSAGVDPLFFNEGFARVLVRGGRRPGDPVHVTTVPARDLPRVRVEARTVEPGTVGRRGPGAARLRRDSSDVLGVILEGGIAADDSVVLSISHGDQRAAYLAALREALAGRGIVVEGSVLPVDSAAVPAPLFSLTSPPLREILRAFEKPSQNQIGEILLKTLGHERTGVGSADSGAVVVRRQLEAWGVSNDQAVVRDGSGLSRHNVVTPGALVRVLDAIRQDTAFAAFRDALPIAGVDGTLANRMRDTPAQDNVRAKTGTLDMVRALSGYVHTADGRLLIFSMLANNWTVSVREIERVQDAIVVRLAALGAPGAR